MGSRKLGLGSPILPVGSADTSERHGVSQLTVQDRDVPGPLKSQGKVHVPILWEARPEPGLSRSRPCCPPGAQMRMTGSDVLLSTLGERRHPWQCRYLWELPLTVARGSSPKCHRVSRSEVTWVTSAGTSLCTPIPFSLWKEGATQPPAALPLHSDQRIRPSSQAPRLSTNP